VQIDDCRSQIALSIAACRFCVVDFPIDHRGRSTSLKLKLKPICNRQSKIFNIFAWGLTFARLCELGRVVPDHVVKELASLTAEYPANGSFFVPLTAKLAQRA
jgi:hypothetical protein